MAVRVRASSPNSEPPAAIDAYIRATARTSPTPLLEGSSISLKVRVFQESVSTSTVGVVSACTVRLRGLNIAAINRSGS